MKNNINTGEISPNTAIQYRVDLQKLISGDYEHTILTNKWISRNIDIELYNKIIHHNDFVDKVKAHKSGGMNSEDIIYFDNADIAKRYIKLISCLIYSKVTYMKIIQVNVLRKTRNIGAVIRTNEYSTYGLDSLKLS